MNKQELQKLITTVKADYANLLKEGFTASAAKGLVRSRVWLAADESHKDAVLKIADETLAAYNIMVVTRNEAERYEAKDFAVYNINNQMRWLLRDEDAWRYEVATATEVLADMKMLGESIVTIELQ